MRTEFSSRVKASAALRANGQYFRECFLYEPDTGILRWRRRPRDHFGSDRAWKTFNSRDAATMVGSNSATGHLTVRINGKAFYCHRVIWEMMRDEIPPAMVIDHINGNPADNRFDNLRLATKSQNGFNAMSSRDLPKGVFFDKERGNYMVYVSANKKRINRRVKTLSEATKLVRELRQEAHGDFTNHGGRRAD